MELLAGSRVAEGRLNKAQENWAKQLLGCRPGTRMRGALAVRLCGWRMRLGTRMLERTVMMLARQAAMGKYSGKELYYVSALLQKLTDFGGEVALEATEMLEILSTRKNGMILHESGDPE